MTSSVNSPADVVNLALVALGFPYRIGSLYDGSLPAKKALDIYAETRDELLRSKDWPFARRSVNVGNTNPVPVGWTYAFPYPADALRIRQVAPQGYNPVTLDPVPVPWSLANTDGGTPALVIVANINPVTIEYVGQVTSPTEWEPLFTAALVEALAAKLGPSLRREMAPMLDPGRAVVAAATADEMLAPNDAAGPVEMPQRQARAQ
jgi:hypothetical protein